MTNNNEIKMMRPFLSDGGYKGESEPPLVRGLKLNNEVLKYKLRLARYCKRELDNHGLHTCALEIEEFVNRIPKGKCGVKLRKYCLGLAEARKKDEANSR